jgi:sporulation protein YlmC with PRC-barrel domain
MALVKYTQVLDDQGCRGFEVYLQHLGKKLGVVEDLLLDADTGLSQYLIVRVGVWPWSHFFLLPIAQVLVDHEQQCFYRKSLKWTQQSYQWR